MASTGPGGSPGDRLRARRLPAGPTPDTAIPQPDPLLCAVALSRYTIPSWLALMDPQV